MSFLSNLFGGNSAPQIQYTPSGITNPSGFSVSSGGGVSESPTLSSNIGGLQSTFGQAAGAFGNLAKTVQPGFSQFRNAGLRDITNQFRSARSNLQDTLAQRRVLGSSFANSQFSQQAADEAQTKANFEAQSYIQELQSSYQLTQAQYSAAAQSFSTAIDQSNIESSTAANLVANNNRISANVATAQADLDARAAAGAGSFLGTVLGLGTGGGNTLGGSLFSGLGSGAGLAADYGAASIFGAGSDAALSASASLAPETLLPLALLP